MNWSNLFDRAAILIALLATLGIYASLQLHGSTEGASVLQDLLGVLAGALAGVSLPRSPS